jgi:hypothetical protein
MLRKAVFGTILFEARKWQNEIDPASGYVARDGAVLKPVTGQMSIREGSSLPGICRSGLGRRDGPAAQKTTNLPFRRAGNTPHRPDLLDFPVAQHLLQ